MNHFIFSSKTVIQLHFPTQLPIDVISLILIFLTKILYFETYYIHLYNLAFWVYYQNPIPNQINMKMC